MKQNFFKLTLISLSLVSLNAQGLSGGVFQQSMLDEFFEEVYPFKQYLDQTQLYEALELLKKSMSDEQTFDENNLEQLNMLFLDVTQVVLNITQEISLHRRQNSSFLSSEVTDDLNNLKKQIADKEKMAERDKKEVQKIKNKYQAEKAEIQKKVSELSKIASEIQHGKYKFFSRNNKVLKNGEKTDYYRILETIESKIVIGVYKINKDNQTPQEIQIFMNQVDAIFKEKDFKRSEIKIKTLISLIYSYSEEVKFQLLNQLNKIISEEEDQLSFYIKGENTHLWAKEFYEAQYMQQYDQFTQKMINLGQILDQTQQIDHQFKKFTIEIQEDSDKRSKRKVNQLQIKQINIKHIQSEVFKKKTL